MNAKTRPGLEIYSDEWMAEVATDVSEPLMPVVRGLCSAWQIGDSDAPNMMARIIERELSDQCLNSQHLVRVAVEEGDEADKRWLSPNTVAYDVKAGLWYYESGGYWYSPEEIEATRRVS